MLQILLLGISEESGVRLHLVGLVDENILATVGASVLGSAYFLEDGVSALFAR